MGGRFAKLLGLGIVLALTSNPAAARFCSQPGAPSVYLSKPSKPFCAFNRSCEKWEIDSYRNELDRYFSKLKQYLAEVDAYNEEAYAYAKCMAELD